MENYKIKLVYWLANQFGYEITMVKMNNVDTKSTISLREITKRYLDNKMKGKKKQVIPVVETPVMTLRDKLKEMGKL
jgi:hypothetical protein